ncbi:hypothetical protein DFH07DRAFT_764312 [Mycena maculata]|uniref:Uncharacterized protein n=1 Tax=Mycena maculata TaxID=230809 RepID=A0AAD7KEG2_9AGAR|nr:hypothetical protein DFH07DRAFT_764312 [Mycena maculata]
MKSHSSHIIHRASGWATCTASLGARVLKNPSLWHPPRPSTGSARSLTSARWAVRLSVLAFRLWLKHSASALAGWRLNVTEKKRLGALTRTFFFPKWVSFTEIEISGDRIESRPRSHFEEIPVPDGQLSLTEADVETYIAPLVKNGWAVRAIPSPIPLITFNRISNLNDLHEALPFTNLPSLARIYHFTTETAAKQFFHAAVATISALPVGVRITCYSTWGLSQVMLRSISELAPHKLKYGISLADVHFAIDLENEFYKN